MFVIVYENRVVLGPMRWNKYRFENFLAEEHEISATLPTANENSVTTVNEQCKIYPIQGSEDPTYNPTIEILHGPFWTFTETHAVSSYQVLPMDPSAVKSFLKARTAAERWRKETAGIRVTVQSQEVFVSTTAGERDKYIQTYLIKSEGDTVQWKFNGVWVTLGKSDLHQIVTAIDTHVQAQFAWESAKVTEIETAETLEQLAIIQIEEPKQ